MDSKASFDFARVLCAKMKSKLQRYGFVAYANSVALVFAVGMISGEATYYIPFHVDIATAKYVYGS